VALARDDGDLRLRRESIRSGKAPPDEDPQVARIRYAWRESAE